MTKTISRAMRAFALLTVMGLASACAQESRTQAMVADVQANAILAEGSALSQAVNVDQVGGGKETDPAWTSQVSTAALRQALELTKNSARCRARLAGGVAFTALDACAKRGIGGIGQQGG